MREHFQWGDMDGNNGYYYQDLSPAELQAVWELGPTLPYWAAFQAVPGVATVDIHLDHEGQPYFGPIPRKREAMAVKEAILDRAEEILSTSKLNPPTVDQIRQRTLRGIEEYNNKSSIKQQIENLLRKL